MPSSPLTQDYGAISEEAADAKENNAQHSSSSIRRTIESKVSLSSFVWHSHSVLGMTVPDDHISPPIAAGPCPCCEVDPEGLTRRRRMFLFLLVFFVSTTLAVQVSVGHHGTFYAFAATVLLVLPLVCHLKENLPTYSRWFMDRGVGPFGRWPGGRDGFRIEELALMACFAIATIKLWEGQHELGMHVLESVLWVWVVALVSEVGCLIFKYYFGKYCCCCFSCCVPSTYRMLDDDEDDDAEAGKANAY